MTRGKSNTTLLLLTAALALAPACGDDHARKREPDAGSQPERDDDAEAEHPDAGEPDCYERPKSYLQIINACTDAERIEKEPVLPQLLPDGTLPPLP